MKERWAMNMGSAMKMDWKMKNGSPVKKARVSAGILNTAILFLAFMLLFPTGASATEVIVMTSGSYGSLAWNFDVPTGKLTISGTGPMLEQSDPPWVYFTRAINTVDIQPGVTSIVKKAFMDCDNLTAVNIPNTVTEMGVYAFQGCSALESVVIPPSFTAFHSIYAFYGCESLKSVTLPDTLTDLGQWTFYGCKSLKSLTIPSGVKEIGYMTLHGCGFSSLTIPDSVTYLDQNSISFCGNLTTLYLGSGLKTIDNIAIQVNPKLKSVYFAGDAPSLYYYADGQLGSFSECPQDMVFYYREGAAGWTSPRWTANDGNTYNTAVYATGLSNFTAAKVIYSAGQFGDVDESAWYGASGTGAIRSACEMGIMAGYSGGKLFRPEGMIRISEAIKMAASVHQIYHGGNGVLEGGNPWYQPYVDYATAHGIIKADEFTNFDVDATRAQMAYIFAGAVPSTELVAVHEAVFIPDVSDATPYGTVIRMLYNAGVLVGGSDHAYRPASGITRAEAAAIISRIVIPATRK